jgi:hypothetical protein
MRALTQLALGRAVFGIAPDSISVLRVLSGDT